MIEFIPNTLKNDPGVLAITDRIKPVGANQDDALPYVTYQVVSDVPTRCREGIATETIRVQVTAFSEGYVPCHDLYKAIRNALDGAQDSTVECQWLNYYDMPYETGYAHGKAIDFQLLTK